MRSAKSKLEHGAMYPYDDPEYMADLTPAPKPATDWAHAAARGVLADLTDRRGVKHELNDIDDDVRIELVASLADIIREAHNTPTEVTKCVPST